MAKRYIFPQHYGERKKAKLDLTVSDHNFPLSQNFGTTKDGDQATTWGDDNADEILLLASQACEEAFNDQISSLPDYSMCMQPSSTSTQNYAPIAGTSKTAFTFKKPTSSPLVSARQAVQCERISSPLPGMSKACKTDGVNVSDDIIINDNLYKGQDSDHVYRQLLKLQEENAKLKSENGKLLEKCVTKEGEVSILRTQLKTCQVAVDNARLDKVRVQERVQMEWSEKLNSANNVAHDLRTQLDFKNLEIISVKEKCKMLESNKVKLTQVTLAGNDISMSQKINSSYSTREPLRPQFKKHKCTSSGVQTENSHFIHLNIPIREEPSKLDQILTIIMTPTSSHCSILENEKLRQSSEMNKCRVFSAFHRLPSAPRVCAEKRNKKLNFNSVCKSLSKITSQGEDVVEYYLDIYKMAVELLQDVQTELESVSQQMMTAFQKQMDQKYIETTCDMVVVGQMDLLSGQILYEEEQAILARRMTVLLVYILEDSRHSDGFRTLLRVGDLKRQKEILDIINRVCILLDSTVCSIPYSSLLLSITMLLKTLMSPTDKQILEIIKTIILSRPMHFVVCEILKILTSSESVKEMCCGSGNLKVDYEQGVLLYKRESCVLQVLLKQVESVLKCVHKKRMVKEAIENTRSVIQLYGYMNYKTDGQPEQHGCDCQTILMQVIVYGLNICANILKTEGVSDTKTDILALCRGGIQVLYRCTADVEFASRLGHNEGHLLEFCEILRDYDHPDVYSNMLSEITGSFQPTVEETPTSYHKNAWLDSFESFSLTD